MASAPSVGVLWLRAHVRALGQTATEAGPRLWKVGIHRVTTCFLESKTVLELVHHALSPTVWLQQRIVGAAVLCLLPLLTRQK